MRRSIDHSYCKVVRATNQTIATSTFDAVSWSSVAASLGSDVSWDSGSPTRLTINRAGWYAVSAFALWPSAAGATRVIGLRKNGTDYFGLSSQPPPLSNVPYMSVAEHDVFLPGEYIECIVYQDSGGGLALGANTGAPVLRATRLAS